MQMTRSAVVLPIAMRHAVDQQSGTILLAHTGSKHATFGGMARVIRSAGTPIEPFTVEVDDCGEPGSADTFYIKTTTYENEPTTLIGGNIQIHQWVVRCQVSGEAGPLPASPLLLAPSTPLRNIGAFLTVVSLAAQPLARLTKGLTARTHP